MARLIWPNDSDDSSLDLAQWLWRQLREELHREAQRLSRVEEGSGVELEKARKDLRRSRDSVKTQRKEAEALKHQAENALDQVRKGREGVEQEREEMLKSFQEARAALEVRCIV